MSAQEASGPSPEPSRRLIPPEAQYAAVLNSALDCIVTIDDQGCVLEFNAAAERTFGYRAEEVLGREIADVIIPPNLRARHHEAFARYLRTGQTRLLERRFETVGMRADRTEFPVELTITRMQVPGRPVIMGFLRDITERKRAEEELRASRQRLVEAHDTERRRLERNLHDGAQQRLVALALTLRLLRAKVPATDDVGELLDRAQEDLAFGIEELREIARGIHPAILTERGLGPALAALASRASVRVELVEPLLDERLHEPVEAAAYYFVSEALTNVDKYAQASVATVHVVHDDGRLVVEVTDDGVGGADPTRGSGLRGLADRVEALDGRFEVDAAPNGGTRLRAEIPLAPQP